MTKNVEARLQRLSCSEDESEQGHLEVFIYLFFMAHILSIYYGLGPVLSAEYK